MKRLIATLSLSLSLLVAPLAAAPAHADVLEEVPSEPVIKAKPAVKKLLGRHALTLQWVETKKKGTIEIWQDGGYLRLKGEQRDPATGNFVTVEGWITKVEAKQFSMRGRIVTRVDHIAEGKECSREGDFTLLIKGARKFWRVQEMQNPCSSVVDYVDISIATVK
jgi:hypothetical protein